MSDPDTKEKRSKRLHHTQSQIKKRLRIRKDLHTSTAEIERHPHKLYTNIGLSCGNSNCVMCGNPRKFWKDETIQEKSFKQDALWDEKRQDDYGWV